MQLADTDYGTPKAVDLLLGAKVFSRVVLHGRRLGPTGSSPAFKTQLEWVLTGTAGDCRHNCGNTKSTCYLATTVEDKQGIDELLRKFREIVNTYFQEPTLSITEKDVQTVVEHFWKNHV